MYFAKVENEILRAWIYSHDNLFEKLVVEMVASYGMPVGKEVFDTCVWIGRYIQQVDDVGKEYDYIYRKDEKITDNILIKSICKQLPEHLFMEYNKLNFNPTKYIVLNSWFDLKGPYTYEFLTEFKEKFYDYIDYNDIFEDYPEYKKYIDEKIYDDYKEKLSFRPTDESITIEKKQHQNYL